MIAQVIADDRQAGFSTVQKGRSVRGECEVVSFPLVTLVKFAPNK